MRSALLTSVMVKIFVEPRANPVCWIGLVVGLYTQFKRYETARNAQQTSDMLSFLLSLGLSPLGPCVLDWPRSWPMYKQLRNYEAARNAQQTSEMLSLLLSLGLITLGPCVLDWPGS